MEIACDILKKSTISERYKEVKRKFRDLKLSDTCRNTSYHSFQKLIQNNKYLAPTISFIEQYFDDVDDDFATSILMAYCISTYPDNLFDNYRSRFEQKLILSANRVVLYIERLLTESNLSEDFHNEFFNIIDHYYSLYKIWKSKDSINKMSVIFDEMKELINIFRFQSRKNILVNNVNNCDNILKLLDELFDLNGKYATRILLHNYDIIKKIPNIELRFWEHVKSNYLENKEALFIILVAELRIRLIPLLTNPSDRKELYYSIDTEDIIDEVRSYEFTQKKSNKIIKILQNKVCIVNKTYNKKDLDTYIDENIIDVFSGMFNAIYQSH